MRKTHDTGGPGRVTRPNPGREELPRDQQGGERNDRFLGSSHWRCLGIPQSHRTEKEIILSAMWKPSQSEPLHHSPTPEPPRPAPQPANVEPANRIGAPAGDQAIISKGLIRKGRDIRHRVAVYRRQGGGRDQPSRQPRDRGPQRPSWRQRDGARGGCAGQSDAAMSPPLTA